MNIQKINFNTLFSMDNVIKSRTQGINFRTYSQN